MNKLYKLCLVILTSVLIISCATGKNLNDPVKEYRLESFSVYDGSENFIQKISITYNELNKPAEITVSGESEIIFNTKNMTYTSTGKLSTLKNSTDEKTYILSEYIYGEDDNLIAVTTVDQKETVLGTSSYINDTKGNPVEWISQYSGSNEKIHFKMEYDDSNNLTRSSELDKSGNLVYYSTSEYNESGKEISYSIYSSEGNLDQQLLSFYKGDQLIKTEIRDETGNILYYTIYDLDDMNRPTLISSYNQYDDLNDKVEISYDEAGNEISRKSFDYEGKLTDKIIKKYDEAGNNTILILYDGNDSIISITKNVYNKKPLNMDEEEFNSLVFKL